MTNPSPPSSPFEEFAERAYNKPLVPSFTRPMTQEDLLPSERGSSVARGTRFLRWHELSDEQQETVRNKLRQALESTGLLKLVEEQPEELPTINEDHFLEALSDPKVQERLARVHEKRLRRLCTCGHREGWHYINGNVAPEGACTARECGCEQFSLEEGW